MVNKSLKYLKKRKQDGDLDGNSWLMLSDFSNPTIRNFFEMFQELYNEIDCADGLDLVRKWKIADKEVDVNIKIVPCKDGKFDYFTSFGSYNDGTLMFYLQSIAKVVEKVSSAQTHFSQKYSLEEVIEKLQSGEYYVLYEVGDMVTTNTDCESPDKDRPFLTLMSCCFLPLKYELVKRVG